ncbi:MAG: hypothetical protein K8R74_00170 [Bacteroidales bacterium]|nr:hypothetical protein [Bacteroidales bacterium]
MAGLTGIVNLRLIPDKDQIFFLRMRVVFININFYPLKQKEGKAISKREKPKKKKKRLGIGAIWLLMKIIRKTIRSFKLKTLYLNLDTDDVISNACLIPVFANLHRDNINLNVNYAGDFEMIINIENNIFNILVVTIKTYLHHKKIL